MIAPATPALLRSRGAAFALLARLLGPDTSALGDRQTVSALRDALDPARDRSALARLAGLDHVPAAPPSELAGRWVRWFDLGRVAPYEGSNVAESAGGVTPRLADVAGFYRAFGMAVSGDRPDHVVAELEFLALVLVVEADAIEQRDAVRAETAAGAARAFLRDHLGTWIDIWAARVGEVPDLAPWFPIAAAAAELVRAEAAERNVIPVRPGAVLSADAGLASPEEAVLACGDAAP